MLSLVQSRWRLQPPSDPRATGHARAQRDGMELLVSEEGVTLSPPKQLLPVGELVGRSLSALRSREPLQMGGTEPGIQAPTRPGQSQPQDVGPSLCGGETVSWGRFLFQVSHIRCFGR